MLQPTVHNCWIVAPPRVREVSHGTLLRSLNAWLSANAGQPSIMAVIAPPTVPEKTVSMPRFRPRLTPDSTSCGGASFIR